MHVNNKYTTDGKPDITKALDSGNSDALLVVGQMFYVDDKTIESASIKALADSIGKVDTSNTVNLKLFNHLMDTG